MTRHPSRRAACTALLLAFAAIFGAEQAVAQIKVGLSFKRRMFVLYEPVVAVVTIENMSGRPLVLESRDQQNWFGFTIETSEGSPVPPINPNYEVAPVAIAPGEKLSRAVNLTPLFPLQEFGSYRIKASIFAEAFGRYFSSQSETIEMTEARPIWQQVVGIPGREGPPQLRTVTLLSHKLSRSTRLYVRIEDKGQGKIYAMYSLGPFLSFGRPEVMLDRRNEIHVLQNSSPKQFLYTHVGLDGEILNQQAYREAGTRPTLVKDGKGQIAVLGGQLYTPGEEEAAAAAADKVGDRPVPLPGR